MINENLVYQPMVHENLRYRYIAISKFCGIELW